jgi:hypothetical protein
LRHPVILFGDPEQRWTAYPTLESLPMTSPRPPWKQAAFFRVRSAKAPMGPINVNIT